MATIAWRDLALDSSGDLVLEVGDLKLLQGTDAIAQECRTALGLWVGEYPFDIELGTRWQQVLNVKGVTDAQLASEIRRVLLGVDGVRTVDSVQIARNTVQRTASVSVTVTTQQGEVFTVPSLELGVGV